MPKQASSHKPTVVITGASSGIGKAIAITFAQKGAKLCLIARNPEKLAQTKVEIQAQTNPDTEIRSFSVDVSVKEAIQQSIRDIGEAFGSIDVLINNVGISYHGRFEDNPSAAHEQVMQVNYFSSLYILEAALPYLKKSRQAKIGFVSSVAGYTGLFGYTSYAPSKFAMAGLAECLRMEFRDYGIQTTIIYPPDTDTPMYRKEQAETLPECKALSKNAKVLTPEYVANLLVKGMESGTFEVHCNGESRLIRIVKGIWPGLYYRIVDGIVAKDRKRRKSL